MRVFCLYPTGWARLTRTKKPVDLEGGGGGGEEKKVF